MVPKDIVESYCVLSAITHIYHGNHSLCHNTIEIVTTMRFLFWIFYFYFLTVTTDLQFFLVFFVCFFLAETI